MKYEITQEEIDRMKAESANKTLIYKGCNNYTCYCTGECKKVIGEIDKATGKNTYYGTDRPNIPDIPTSETDHHKMNC